MSRGRSLRSRWFLGAAALLVAYACATAPPGARRPAVTSAAAELTRITSDDLPEYWPAPSPDGSMLLFNQRDDARLGNQRFAIIRMVVGSPARILVTDEAASMASWYPDNRFFAYDSGRTGQLRIVRSVAAGGGGGMTFLTSSTTGDSEQHPDVSANGTLIALNAMMRGDTVIATIEEGSSNVTVYGQGLMPRWSPDGTRIAYHWRDRGWWQIFIMDVGRGAQVTQLTAAEANNHSPDWSPDGEYLTYVSNQDGREHVYLVRADGTEQTQLTSGDSNEQGPAWSSDGFIYFGSDASGNWDIWRIRPILG